MKKTNPTPGDDMRSEYDFASMKGGVRGKYAERTREGTNIVLIEPEVSEAFPTEQAVNEALNGVLNTTRAVRKTGGEQQRLQPTAMRRPRNAVPAAAETRSSRNGGAVSLYAADSLATRSFLRFRSACQRSYCICWLIQLSAVVPNASDSRTAISGLIPARPFRMLDSVLRLTPNASAACVTVRPRGFKHNSRSTSPGCGGLCIFMARPQW